MSAVSSGSRSYETDTHGFLKNARDWDEGFAEAMAPQLGIHGGLTPRHWEIIRFIRNEYRQGGECPLVFTTCRAMALSLKDLEELFPTGYLRGACRLAGVTNRDRFVNYFGEPAATLEATPEGAALPQEAAAKVYRVDVHGYLVDPDDWDEAYAAAKAREMKVPGGLTPNRLHLLHYLRERYRTVGTVPTVAECCAEYGLDLDQLEALFPDGYHRGAVKLAGLCVRTG